MDAAEQRGKCRSESRQSNTGWQLLRGFDIGSKAKAALDEPRDSEMTQAVTAKTGTSVRSESTT